MSPSSYLDGSLAPHAPECTGHHCVDCGACLSWDPRRTSTGKARIDVRIIRRDSRCVACRDDEPRGLPRMAA